VEEAEAARVAEEEAFATKLAAEAKEAARVEEEDEAAATKLAAEEAEAARVEEEEAAAMKLGAEEVEAVRVAEEEAATKFAAEEAEAARVAEEEAAATKLGAEEVEAARVAEEAELVRVAEAEAAATKFAAEEAEVVRVAEEEAAATKLAAEEAEAARVAEEEAAATKLAAEEADTVRTAEEEEEAAATKFAAEEAEAVRVVEEEAFATKFAAEEMETARVVEDAAKAVRRLSCLPVSRGFAFSHWLLHVWRRPRTQVARVAEEDAARVAAEQQAMGAAAKAQAEVVEEAEVEAARAAAAAKSVEEEVGVATAVAAANIEAGAEAAAEAPKTGAARVGTEEAATVVWRRSYFSRFCMSQFLAFSHRWGGCAGLPFPTQADAAANLLAAEEAGVETARVAEEDEVKEAAAIMAAASAAEEEAHVAEAVRIKAAKAAAAATAASASVQEEQEQEDRVAEEEEEDDDDEEEQEVAGPTLDASEVGAPAPVLEPQVVGNEPLSPRLPVPASLALSPSRIAALEEAIRIGEEEGASELVLATLREAFRIAYVINVVNEVSKNAVDGARRTVDAAGVGNAAHPPFADATEQNSEKAKQSAQKLTPKSKRTGKARAKSKSTPKEKIDSKEASKAKRKPKSGKSSPAARQGLPVRPQQGLRWSGPKSSDLSYYHRLERESPELALAVAARAREVAETELKLKQLARRQVAEKVIARRATREAELNVVAKENAAHEKALQVQRRLEQAWTEKQRMQRAATLRSARLGRLQEKEEHLNQHLSSRVDEGSPLRPPGSLERAYGDMMQRADAMETNGLKGRTSRRRSQGAGTRPATRTVAGSTKFSIEHVTYTDQDQKLLDELATDNTVPPPGMPLAAAAMIAHAAQYVGSFGQPFEEMLRTKHKDQPGDPSVLNAHDLCAPRN
jgi:hypothetical protein